MSQIRMISRSAFCKRMLCCLTSAFALLVFANASASPDSITPAGAWIPFGDATANGTDGAVNAMIAYNGYLYVGGAFTHVGATAANHVARWDGTSWSTLGSGIDDVVDAFATDGTYLYIGGQFLNAGGAAASRVVRWDGSNFAPLAGGVGPSGASGGTFVSGMAIVGGKLYVVGMFNQADAGNVFPLKNVAAWDITGATWSDVGGGVAATAKCAIAYQGVLYVGGQFTSSGFSATPVPTKFIAAWNGSAWSQVSSGMNGEVDAMAVVGNALYAGGGFSKVNGTATNASRVARLSGTWSALGSGLSTTAVGDSGRALAQLGSILYVGGQFSTAGGLTANNVAQWDGTAWASVGENTENGVDGRVLALAAFGGDVYVGGTFAHAGSQTSANIARWHSDTLFADGFEGSL